MLATLSKMFNMAERWGLRPVGTNPCRGLEKYRERPRRRYLSGEELGRLGATLATAERDGALPVPGLEGPQERRRSVDLFAVAAIRLLLFTGARLSEILTLRWDVVDLERACLRLGDSKTGQKDVHLNAPALAVLAALPRVDGCPYVIAGRLADRPRPDLNGPWTAIRAAAGIPDLRLHDLRHSFASVAVGAGLALPLIGGLLGHAQPATTARYAHLQDDPLKAAAERIGDRLAAAIGGGR